MLKPFYMWAGGKSKLIKDYDPVFPTGHWPQYVEPFYGGGAVYSWLFSNDPAKLLAPLRSFESVVLNDVNSEVVGLLNEVKNAPDELLKVCDGLLDEYLKIDKSDKDARKEFYYDLRARYWDAPDCPTLLVLMRLGFNGIWQTCKKSRGLYGTPAGLMNQTNRNQIIDKALIREWSDLFAESGAIIHCGDYQTLESDDLIMDGALVYCDPPYRDSFTTYGTGFDDAEQSRLCEWCKHLVADRGCTVCLSNRDDPSNMFFGNLLPDAEFHWFDVTYTAGRRKKTESGYEAKKAKEFLAVLKP